MNMAIPRTKKKSSRSGLTHLDADDRPRMVDVSDKAASLREATAEAVVKLPKAVAIALAASGHRTHKGPVFDTAIIAAVHGFVLTPDRKAPVDRTTCRSRSPAGQVRCLSPKRGILGHVARVEAHLHGPIHAHQPQGQSPHGRCRRGNPAAVREGVMGFNFQARMFQPRQNIV